MDFSAWNWASSFRLHEVACLIAGVMPISKRQPTSEELPPQARPILVKLMTAYIEWILQKKNPDRPKSIFFLEGYLNDDGAPPEINSLAELPGSLVSRDAVNRFLLQIEGELGLKSVYDFGSICKAADQRPAQAEPTPVAPPLNEAPTPAPANPLQRSAAQGLEILAAIRDAGHDPNALPVNEPGKPGVKAFIRKSLNESPLFVGNKVFDKAWERLRSQGDIADAA